ncbi:MAG TPA: alpha/beta fold hydrolase [Polyangiaceae bacterium]
MSGPGSFICIARAKGRPSYSRPASGTTAACGVKCWRRRRASRARALTTASVSGPFMLVGHSLGGLNAQLYASRHTSEVAGLVLVDSSSPHQDERYWTLIPRDKLVEFDRHLRQGREGLSLSVFGEGMAEARAGARLRENLPLAVLTAGQARSHGVGPELDAQLTQVWLELQRELATLSANGVQVVSKASGHYVQKDDPALVVAAVFAVVRAARTGGRLESIFAPPAAVKP